MAMQMARAHLRRLGREEDVEVESRGLTDRYSPWGSPADPRAARALEKGAGLNSDGHASRALTEDELEACAACFYVTDDHVDWIASTVGRVAVDAALNRGTLRKICAPDEDVPDPFFAEDDEYYLEIVHKLEGCVDSSLDAFLAEQYDDAPQF